MRTRVPIIVLLAMSVLSGTSSTADVDASTTPLADGAPYEVERTADIPYRDEAWRAYLRKYGMAAEKPRRLPDGTLYPPPFEWSGPPESYVVEYEGIGRDEAEFEFELDEARHRLDGYVVAHREWREEHGIAALVRWLTWSCFRVRYWGPLFSQPPRHAAGFRPGKLFVTYVLDDEQPPSEEG